MEKGKWIFSLKRKIGTILLLRVSTSVKGFLVQKNTLMTIYANLAFSGMQAEASA